MSVTTQHTPFDYTALSILHLDPDPIGRRYFRQIFSGRFRILDAADEQAALAILRRQPDDIAIILVDETVLETRGELLKTSLSAHPGIIHIFSVQFARLTSDLGTYHEEGQKRHIVKPWDIAQLDIKLRRAMEFQLLQRRSIGAAPQSMMVADG